MGQILVCFARPKPDLFHSAPARHRAAQGRAARTFGRGGLPQGFDRRTVQHTVQLEVAHDLVAAGRKLGGILIELSAELERIHYVIVGIGLNVNDTFRDAPEEVQKRATSIAQFTGRVRRVPLLQRLLAALEQEYQLFLAEGPEKLLAHYRTFCATVGQQVSVYSRGELVAAGLAEDIDSGGNLLVRSKEGSLTPVTSGEVSLRQE